VSTGNPTGFADLETAATSSLPTSHLPTVELKSRHYAIDKRQQTVISSAAIATEAVPTAADRAERGPKRVEMLCVATSSVASECASRVFKSSRYASMDVTAEGGSLV
jgi:3-oxoacyl-[acyl-carrier-protein] synthase-3